MNPPDLLPLWADLLISVLVLLGAGIVLIGAWGLVRLETFFERVHTPAIMATLGCWCVMHAALLYFSMAEGALNLRLLLIALFVAITVPITSVFLMRAALFRARRTDQAVPTSLSLDPESVARVLQVWQREEHLPSVKDDRSETCS